MKEHTGGLEEARVVGSFRRAEERNKEERSNLCQFFAAEFLRSTVIANGS